MQSISIEQIKAARALLGWNQDDLSKSSTISKNAINNLERAVATPRGKTLQKIQRALEEAGVEFTEGPGVRLRGNLCKTEMFEGKDSVWRLLGDIVETLRADGKTEFLLSGVDEQELLGRDAKRLVDFLSKCRKYDFYGRYLVKDGTNRFLQQTQHYRFVAAEVFGLMPYCVYSDKYAVILPGKPWRVVVTQNRVLANSYRKQFLELWHKADAPE